MAVRAALTQKLGKLSQVQCRNEAHADKGGNNGFKRLAHSNDFFAVHITVLLLHLYSLSADNLYLITLSYFRFIALHTRQHTHTYTDNSELTYMYRSLAVPLATLSTIPKNWTRRYRRWRSLSPPSHQACLR